MNEVEELLVKYFSLKDKSKAIKKQRRDLALSMDANSKGRDCEPGNVCYLDERMTLDDYCEWCLVMDAPSKELHKNAIEQRAILSRLRSRARRLTNRRNYE